MVRLEGLPGDPAVKTLCSQCKGHGLILGQITKVLEATGKGKKVEQ